MGQKAKDRDWARQLIREAGLRATPARIATLLVLHASATPLTHAEVVELLVDYEYDKATIFRNLNDLVAVNLLRRTELGDRAWRFEFISDQKDGHAAHPHFVCVDCGNVSCLDQFELTGKSKSESNRFGEVTEVLLRGHCHDCA